MKEKKLKEEGERAYLRSASDVASHFFPQKLEDTKERVQRWEQSVREADEEGKESYHNLALYDACQRGILRCVLPEWQARMFQQRLRKRWMRNQPKKVWYEGKNIGTWQFLESTMDDPYNRLHYTIDPSLIQTYMQVDPHLLAIVIAQIEQE